MRSILCLMLAGYLDLCVVQPDLAVFQLLSSHPSKAAMEKCMSDGVLKTLNKRIIGSL